MYKYDLHVHIKPGSSDASGTPTAILDSYVKEGYSGIVVTNHYDAYQLEYLKCGNLLKDKNSVWMNGYLNLKEIAENLYPNFKVWFGCEYTIEVGQTSRHILLYGENLENYFKECKIKPYMSLKELREALPDCILVEAHPFRINAMLLDNYVDGYELVNTKNTNSAEIAMYMWLDTHMNEKHVYTGGNDFHIPTDVKRGGGIATYSEIFSVKDLLKVLRNDEHEVLKLNN